MTFLHEGGREGVGGSGGVESGTGRTSPPRAKRCTTNTGDGNTHTQKEQTRRDTHPPPSHIRRLAPTDNAPSTNFRLSSDAEIFVAKHRLEHASRRRNAQKKRACDVRMFRLSFNFCVPPQVVGQWRLGATATSSS